MSIENFLMKNVETTEKVEVYLSERFKAPFIIRAISEEENAALRKSCRNKVKQKYGQYTTEMDQDLYLTRLVAACTVEPDFKSAELQADWRVIGEESLIRKMLLPGEYTELLEQIQLICGFDLDVEAEKEAIKKPTEKETASCTTPSTVSMS